MKKIHLYLPLSLAAVVTLCVLAIGPSAAYASPPVYVGLTTFPTIYSPAEPEEFSWEVILEGGEEMRQIDEQEIVVYYSDGHRAFGIQAEPAADADDVAVPTSIQVTGENIFTLTVHHREGNPAAGGAPFHYPITAGQGSGGVTVPTEIQGPPDEKELREQREREEREEREQREKRQEAEIAAQAKPCHVPALRGATVAGARRRLRRANCRLGAIAKSRGVTRRTGRVVHQSEPAGTTLEPGARVSIRLGPGGSLGM
ncbi:MAG: PASTA domain-containing protein [Solirubrobacterales bacterium]